MCVLGRHDLRFNASPQRELGSPFLRSSRPSWLDHLIILCHACKDDTAAIAVEIQVEAKGRVTVIVEPEP